MKKNLFLLILFIIFYSCGIFRPRVDLNQGGTNRAGYYETISFDHIREKIILPVMINGKIRQFIFDTGAPTIISESLQKEMQYETLGEGLISDVHQNEDRGTFVKVESLSLGDVEFSNIPALVSDMSNLPWNCFQVDGFIGSNLLRNSVVQINADEQEFILASDTRKFKNLGKENLMRLDRQSSPYIKFGIAGERNRYVLFDTGSEDFVNISLEYFETLKKHRCAFNIEKEGYGNGIMGLFGTGREGKVYRLKMDSLRFDQTTITEPVVEVTNTSDKLGAELLKYGIVTLDYPNKKFYFYSENETLPFKEKRHSELGFRPVILEDTLRVGLVWEHSLVDSLGLEAGDEIIQINDYQFRDSLKSSFCNLLLNDSLIDSKVFHIKYIDDEGNFKRIKMRRKKK
ncbi:MAG: retropepsin-like aspartic protease [Bacteroidales bacterium]